MKGGTETKAISKEEKRPQKRDGNLSPQPQSKIWQLQEPDQQCYKTNAAVHAWSAGVAVDIPLSDSQCFQSK